jgi:hypothetical protein
MKLIFYISYALGCNVLAPKGVLEGGKEKEKFEMQGPIRVWKLSFQVSIPS